MIEKKHYIAQLKTAVDHEGRRSGISPQDEAILDEQLDELMWMTEITLPELYTTNKRKLGEILLPLKLPDAAHDAIDESRGSRIGGARGTIQGRGPAPILFRMVNHILLYGTHQIWVEWGSHVDLYKRVSIDVEY